jgi:hypothetical protein
MRLIPGSRPHRIPAPFRGEGVFLEYGEVNAWRVSRV